ncbi:hypothetical protein D3Z53_13075 [Lachnospiraceae bacterium]|jgi:hypothetical protein|nr:hypothetical protein [uncultured Schaedlerella sp.]NBI58969.1 hypothetical protein [Lachnospiraceae bacterium]
MQHKQAEIKISFREAAGQPAVLARISDFRRECRKTENIFSVIRQFSTAGFIETRKIICNICRLSPGFFIEE